MTRHSAKSPNLFYMVPYKNITFCSTVLLLLLVVYILRIVHEVFVFTCAYCIVALFFIFCKCKGNKYIKVM